MFKTDYTIEDPKPPQGPHIPNVELPKHCVIKLTNEDAVRFHECFARERALLKGDELHWLKDKDLSDITDSKTVIYGIKDQGDLVSGSLLTMPGRQIVNKLKWYPWDAKSEHTAVLGSVWTEVSHRGHGMATAIVEQAIEDVKNSDIKPDLLFGGLRYILASVAENNAGSRAMFKKLGFHEVPNEKPNPIHGKPMVYVCKPVF